MFYQFSLYFFRVSSQQITLSYLKCVVLIRPTSENIRLLAKEIANPRYGSYFVYFTNRASKADLKTLAESDGNEVVGDVKEIPSDFLVFDSHVFTVKVMSPIKNLRWNQTNSALNRCTDGIRSLMLALKGTRANICWAKDDLQKMTLCQELAQGIKTEITSDGGLPGDTLIVLLDRRIDPITPLLNQWTYQAMVHELIGLNNNRVDLTGREEIPDEMKNLTLSGDSDEFYRLNMYANFGEIGEAIQKLVKNFQEKKGNMGGKGGKLDSISDIKDFITEYPEFKKMSGTVSKHVALVTELSKEVTANDLCKVSELEQNIACGQERDNSISHLLEILKMENIRKKDALRLISLYTIRYEREVQKNLDVLCRSVRGMYLYTYNSCILLFVFYFYLYSFAKIFFLQLISDVPRKEVYEVIEMTKKFSRHKSRYLFDDNSTPFSTNFFKGLKGVENVYTQHIPLITKEFLPDFVRGKKREDFHYEKPPIDVPAKVILFFVGGITYEETRAVAMFNRDNGTNVVIGGTSILNFDNHMEFMREACTLQN